MEPKPKPKPELTQYQREKRAPLLPAPFGQMEELREMIANIIRRLPPFREFQGLDPDKLIANEIDFQRRVLSALSQWNEQGPSYVLWDKDGTIGDYRYVAEQVGWFFRPGIVDLLKSAKDLFPNLKHGILSHRHCTSLEESFDTGGQFSELQGVFDRKHIYSSRSYEIYSDQELSERSGISRLPHEDRASHIKLIKLREVQTTQPEITFRPIDDLAYTIRLGFDGLYVGDLPPDQIIRVLALGCALETGEYPYLPHITKPMR